MGNDVREAVPLSPLAWTQQLNLYAVSQECLAEAGFHKETTSGSNVDHSRDPGSILMQSGFYHVFFLIRAGTGRVM